MLKQILFLGCFIFFIGNICSQSVAVLTINITNSKGEALNSKLAYMYNGEKKIAWSFSDEKGNFSFIIESPPLQNDSIFILINITKQDSVIIKLNELFLFNESKIENHNIFISEYLFFETYNDFKKYYNNNVFPKRKKTKAKDVK